MVVLDDSRGAADGADSPVHDDWQHRQHRSISRSQHSGQYEHNSSTEKQTKTTQSDTHTRHSDTYRACDVWRVHWRWASTTTATTTQTARHCRRPPPSTTTTTTTMGLLSTTRRRARHVRRHERATRVTLAANILLVRCKFRERDMFCLLCCLIATCSVSRDQRSFVRRFFFGVNDNQRV